MKRLTPTEAKAKALVTRLIAYRKRITDTDQVQQMADGVGVERETMSRWLNWAITPRGLSVPAIERYLEKVEA